MTRVYAPILHEPSGLWAIGVIEGQQSRHLSPPECERICSVLNLVRDVVDAPATTGETTP